MEDRHRSRIRGVFHNHGIARTHKGFADQIEGLLAAVGNEQIFILGCNTVAVQHLEQCRFQRRIAIRRTKIQHLRPFAAKHGVHASLEFFDRKELLCRAGHHKRKCIFRNIGSETAEDFFAAFIGKEQFPADAPVSIQNWRCRRGDLQAVTVSLNERTASHVALNETFRFQLGVGIGYRGAMNAEHGREFTAGRNAIARAQISGVDEGPQLIAKLDVQRNVALRLEMEWKHCLSPSANSTRYWPDARANLSSPCDPSGACVRSMAGLLDPLGTTGRSRDERPSANRLAPLLDTHYQMEAESKSCPV